MANAPAKDSAEAEAPGEYIVAPIRRDIVTAYESMLASVPDAGGNGLDGILEAIARATRVTDLDSPWRTAGLEAYRNVRLRVTGIRKLPSDYTGGLAWFLVIDAAIAQTGELVTITTGALSVVAQLVKAWSMDTFPLDVFPRMAERASAGGFYPWHLEIVG